MAAALLLLISMTCFASTSFADDVGGDDAMELHTVTYDQWLLKLADFQPDIVVVDLWATWCSSCLERFPHMVEMSKQYNGQGIRFVSLLLEDPEETEAIEHARALLTKWQAGFDHYFMNENLMRSFENLDLLGIPAVFIYAPDGALAHKLTGDNPNDQFTETDIISALEQMLRRPD